MWLKVLDNKAYFATHFIHIKATDEIREKINLQVENDGVVCYNVDELAVATKKLDELGASYTVEELTVDPTLVAKTDGVKYQTPEEVRAHLLEDAEPESAVIPNLRKQIQEIQQENLLLKDRLTALESAIPIKSI